MSIPDNIHPSMTYTATKKEIQQFIDKTGSWIMFSGYMYDIKTKKIFNDRYEVTFKARKYGN